MKNQKIKLFVVMFVTLLFVLFSFSAFASENDTTEIASNEYGYVSEGLVSLYMGSGNEGKTVWEDLAGDNDITGLITNEKNFFTNKGFAVNDTTQYFPAAIIDDVISTSAFTVEIHLRDFTPKGESWCHILKHDTDNFSLFLDSTGNILKFKNVSNDGEGDRPYGENMLEVLQDVTLTLTFEAGGNSAIYLDGKLLSSKAAAKSNLKVDSTKGFFFGNGFSAVYESMRFYNRVLTAEEILINSAADVVKNEYGYTADGLISYYEGSGNVGKTTWEDLAGDNDITSLVINGSNYFNEKGFLINDKMHYFPATIVDNVVATSAFTVEVHVSEFAPTGDNWCHILKFDNDNFSFYIDSTGDTLKFKNEAANGSGQRPASNGMLEKLKDGLLTLTFEAGGKTAIYLNGKLLSSETAAASSLNISSADGGFFFGNGFHAVYESMRFYNRVLEPREILANAITEFTVVEGEPDPEPEPTDIPYVIDGLVSYYEGNGDTGRTVWEDIWGDNDITNLKIDTNNYFTEEGYKIYTVDEKAGIMPSAIESVLAGNTFTFEIHISDFKDTVMSQYNDFLKHDANDFSFYRQRSSDTVFLKNNGDGSRPTVTQALDTLQDAILTVTFEKGGKTAIYVNGVLSSSVDASSSNIGFYNGNGNNLYFGYNVDAVYKAMRFYNRILTENEIKSNVEAAGMTPPPSFITVAQPVTNIVGDISAIRVVDSEAELSELLEDANMLPATAIFTADENLNILDENGNAFSNIAEIIPAMGYQIIPAFRVETEAAAVAVGEWLNENFADAFIISSSPSILASGRKVAPLVGGVIDYSESFSSKNILTKDDCIALRKEIFKNMATVAIIPGALCKADIIQYLYDRQVGVWASISDIPTAAEVFGAVNSGALGVISDATDRVLTVALNLPEMTMTRVPLNIAHMGFADTGIKRNHISGIKYSYEKGGKTIEFDVYLTAEDTDGSRQLIVNHDAIITATDGNTYTISETPWSKLKNLKTVSGEYEFDISTLESIFEYFKDKDDAMLVVELKVASDISIVEETWNLITEYGLYDNVTVITFSTDFIAKSREICPEMPFAQLGYSKLVFEGNTDSGIIAVKKLVGATNAIYEPSVGTTVADGSARAMLKRGMLLYAFDNETVRIPWYFMSGTSAVTNDWIDGNIIDYPLNINLVEVTDGEYVTPGETISIGAVVDSYKNTDTSISDFTIEILDGEELVTVDGYDMIFGESTGKVTFVLSYTKSIPRKMDGETVIYPEMNYTVYSDPITVIVESFDGAVKTEGFSIKLKSTKTASNGLRAIFSFDYNKNSIFEEKGFKLVEYGAIVLSEEKYIADGNVVIIDPSSYELKTSGKKIVIWGDDGNTRGKVLNTVDNIEYYCVAVTNYNDYYDDNVYFCAYSIYTDSNGKNIVTVKDYGVDGYNAVNIYQITLDMYINGAINASNTDETAVWNTLLTGAVTLTEKDYKADQVYRLDEEGKATTEYYSGDFVFKEIPVWMNKQVNRYVNLTIVNNPNYTADDSSDDTWIAIYRGSGSLVSHYDNCDYGQLLAYHSKSNGDSMDLDISSEGLSAPSPRLLSSSSNKIKTIILDDGITSFGDHFWFRLYKVETIVYPESLEAIAGSGFYYMNNLSTVYMAKAEAKMQNNINGLVDISNVPTVDTYQLIRTTYGMSAVHLPSNITSIGNRFREDENNNRMTKIWCGDTAEPKDGIIDLTGAESLEKLGNNCLNGMGKITVVKLPDRCVEFGTNVFSGTPIAELWQETYNSTVAAYCETNGFKYCNMKGNEHTVSVMEFPSDAKAG